MAEILAVAKCALAGLNLQAIVQSLFVYPVKACHGVVVDCLRFDSDGSLQGDREWAVVDAQGAVVWQGAFPRLARVQPAFDQDRLTLRALADGVAAVPVNPAGAPRDVRIYNESTRQHDTFSGFDGGEPAAQLLTSVVGAPLRIVRLGVDARRRDGVNPVHIVSLSSIAEVNDALQRQGHSRVTAERFRPNIVLTGAHEPLLPFIEEYVSAIHWHASQLDGSMSSFRSCIRCMVMDVGPESGALSVGTLETLTQLSAQRHPGQATRFGVYATPGGCATLAVGMALDCALSL